MTPTYHFLFAYYFKVYFASKILYFSLISYLIGRHGMNHEHIGESSVLDTVFIWALLLHSKALSSRPLLCLIIPPHKHRRLGYLP